MGAAIKISIPLAGTDKIELFILGKKIKTLPLKCE